MDKHIENMQKAVASMKIADHITYVTYPLMKEKRLLLKALEEIYNSILNLINAILQYDYIWKRIQLYKDPRINFDTFKNKCSRRYNISENELSQIIEILSVVESHKKSPMEFMRKEKVIIMLNDLKTT